MRKKVKAKCIIIENICNNDNEVEILIHTQSVKYMNLFIYLLVNLK